MVQKVKTISSSSVEHYDNRSDESRVYDIEANVNVSGTQVSTMDSGMVFKDGVQVSHFNSWDVNQLNVTYMGLTPDEQNIVNAAVNTFISEVKETVENN